MIHIHAKIFRIVVVAKDLQQSERLALGIVPFQTAGIWKLIEDDTAQPKVLKPDEPPPDSDAQ
jgi:hypothetical protein